MTTISFLAIKGMYTVHIEGTLSTYSFINVCKLVLINALYSLTNLICLSRCSQTNKGSFPDNKELSVVLSAKPELKKYMKRVMPFVQAMRDKVAKSGISAINLTLDFDEVEILSINKGYLEYTLDVSCALFCN